MGHDSWASERQIARHHSAAASLDVSYNETRARREERETAVIRRLPEKPNQGMPPPHENHGLGALLHEKPSEAPIIFELTWSAEGDSSAEPPDEAPYWPSSG